MELVTWNTQWCCGVDGVVAPERIIEGVQAMGGCDVLCLQEVAINYPGLRGEPGDQLAQLQDLLPDWQLFFGAAVDEFTSQGRQQFGNLIATRLPVLQVQHHPLPYPADDQVRSMPRMCTVLTVQDPELGPVRVLNTHLEFHSKRQRMSQARFLRRMHFEALSQTIWAPLPAQDGTPYQSKSHTSHAILCGDMNIRAQVPEYEALCSKAAVIECLDAGWPESVVGARWSDAWWVLHPNEPQPATFCVHDTTYGEEACASDYVWVSDSLRPLVRSFEVDSQTQASDHQPVRVVIGSRH
ncbi:MAG: endonuclease/exonuclease/phosphatase family protein [Comamonas sp.]